MFLESFWDKISFDILPTLPIHFSFLGLLLLLIFVFFPSYISYAKQSIQRKRIYLFSIFNFILFYICIFINLEDFHFDRGNITIFAKTLYLILFLGSLLDVEDKESYPYRRKSFIKKYIRHPLESFFAHIVYVFFKILPARVASSIGGFMGKFVGLFANWYNHLVYENLNIAFPRKDMKEKKKIKSRMWDMIGRYVAEPSHFMSIYRKHKNYITFKNDKILDKLNGKPYIALASHCGSLGLISIPFALHHAPCSIIYKYPSNNLTNNLVTKSFGRGIGKLKFIPNTPQGSREAMKILKNGNSIIVIPDQSSQSGIATKFFGQKVKSPSGLAKLAIHFNCPILPIQLVRTGGFHHNIIFHEPFHPFQSNNKELDIKRTTQKANDIIEGWIKENPSQWFWVHDRWKIKKFLQEKLSNKGPK